MNNTTIDSKAVDQLVQYFTISDACLEGLGQALGATHSGLVDDICSGGDSVGTLKTSNALTIKIQNADLETENISPKSESQLPRTSLSDRQVQSSPALIVDPLHKFKDQLEESESAVSNAQTYIKEKIRDGIEDTRKTINALMKQAEFLQIASDCQKERENVLQDSKTIKKNLKENHKKITKHIKNFNVDTAQKKTQLSELETLFKEEMHSLEQKESLLKDKVKATQKNISSHTKRIKKQSEILKTEISDLQGQLKLLMLAEADKRAIYAVFAKTIAALQNASDSGISKTSLKITVKVVKGIISIALTIFQEGISLSAFKSSLQTIIETGQEVLTLYKQKNLV